MYDERTLDLWDLDWLTDKFKEEVVDKEMKQAWAIEEIEYGANAEDIENLIWKDYPAWAEQKLLDAKEYILD